MMQATKNKKNKLILFFLSFLICLSFLFYPMHKANAALWPAIDPIIRTALAEIKKTIFDMLVGAGKKVAIQAILKKMTISISGDSSGGTMFITNWNQTLNLDPEAKARATMTKFIASMTSGRGGSSYIPNISLGAKFGNNYEGVGSGSLAYGLGGIDAVRATTDAGSAPAVPSYAKYIQEIAKNSLENTDCKLTYYGRSNNENIFKDLSRNIDNSGWKMQNCVEQKRAEELAKEEKIAVTKATSSGMKGKEDENGNTQTPAGIVGAQVYAALASPIDTLTNCSDMGCIVTSLVTSGMNKVFDGMVNMEDTRSKEKDAQNSATAKNGISKNLYDL